MIAAAGISVVRLRAEVRPPMICQNGPSGLRQTSLPGFMLVMVEHEHGLPVFPAGEVVLFSSFDMLTNHFDVEDIPADMAAVPRVVVVLQVRLTTLCSPITGPVRLGDGG